MREDDFLPLLEKLLANRPRPDSSISESSREINRSLNRAPATSLETSRLSNDLPPLLFWRRIVHGVSLPTFRRVEGNLIIKVTSEEEREEREKRWIIPSANSFCLSGILLRRFPFRSLHRSALTGLSSTFPQT